jgi:hypothetical protein
MALTVQVLREYLHVWVLVEGLHLKQDILDQHWWRFSLSGMCTSKEAKMPISLEQSDLRHGREFVPKPLCLML